jgi:photosystem II stability/assembly factor-like uncharacterized protein
MKRLVLAGVLMLAVLSFGAPAGARVPLWTQRSTDSFSDLVFLDSVDGCAFGVHGIWHTVDKGTTWTLQLLLPGISLNDWVFVDAQHGWVVGDDGTVVATSDGGSNWSYLNSGTILDLYSVTFRDASNGWAVGEQGTVIHTADGGAHWDTQLPGDGYSLFAAATPGRCL